MINIDINGFNKFLNFNKAFKKTVDEIIKIEVNKIFVGMHKDFLKTSLFYHCPNIMKKMRLIKK